MEKENILVGRMWTVAVRLKEQDYYKLKEYAEKRSVSMSTIAKFALAEYQDRHRIE